MVIELVSKTFTRMFGSRNERMVKAYTRRVQQINALESEVRKLTDAQLRAQTAEFQQQLQQGTSVSELMPRIMATAREIMDRSVGIRNIFNPAFQFDPASLPEDLQQTYQQLAQQAAELQPVEEPGCDQPVEGWMQIEIPMALYEAVRELYPKSRPPFRARPFDVQLIGGMVLGEGRIAEMKTGEGKTIVAPLACYVACMEQLQCHVVTVNDYLVQRDRDWVFPFYYWSGLTVGAIHPFHMQPPEKKQEAYNCNVVYGTNSEFGFDYLRDNMKLSAHEQVQKQRDFCIIDEVDSILIDEARTPLIISGPAHQDAPRYDLADKVARHLVQKQREWDAADVKVQQCLMKIKGLEGDIRNARDKARIPQMKAELQELQGRLPQLEAARDQYVQYYEVEREKKASHLTHEGVAEAQKAAGMSSFYVGQNMDFPHLLENALRAHVIYQRDKDYVVQNGEVIIVDEFTGRLMVGRQWSDGLHQAVEAKENVKIKQETQTLATVTIQNYFKLYKRLAGMTGTAITEATEFNEIYKLDVVCIPTNLPVVRQDNNDLIFLSQKDKWNAILEEIRRFHDIGRPVLVGTTSVEKSEMLSGLLSKRYGIKHEVLNAKQHEREAQIVLHAGELGAVMIATNMAGRGTDIKLAPIDRAVLVRHWQQRNLLPKTARPEMSDQELIALSYRHQAQYVLGVKEKDLADKSDQDIRLMLLRQWVQTQAWVDSKKAAGLSAEECMRLLDALPGFSQHRLEIYQHIEQMGGLHIVGTERHESRRIDNQLRGRAGRQGDNGSSRFFISLEDELMQLFAGKTTLNALSRLGMKEGDAIEHRWLTRSVERAQRKVEERNYQIRKQLLEYDEVMEYQRNTFYDIRQQVLEGRNIPQISLEYIRQSVGDAVGTYLDEQYTQTQIAEWCRQTLDVSVEPGKLPTDDLEDLKERILAEARTDVQQTIDVTLGEYCSDDVPPEEWDLRGLSHWAMSHYSVDLKQNQLRGMNVTQIKGELIDGAIRQLERKDLSGLTKFLEPLYAETQLADWAREKFSIELNPEELSKLNGESASEHIYEKAAAAYSKREVTYPVDFALDMTFEAARHDGTWAAAQLSGWARQKFDLDWQPEQIVKRTREDMHRELIEVSEAWVHGDRLEKLVDQQLAEQSDPAELAKWAQQRFGQKVEPQQLEDSQTRRSALIDAGRQMLRAELTQLERFVLLQILDTAWKDHLYAMDQLKDSVGLRGFAEKDPRIEYKREGSNLFAQMQATVRDRVTDLIFRARLTASYEQRNVYEETQATHAQARSAVTAAAAAQASPQQQADLAAAEQTGSESDDDSHLSRKARRARAAESRSGKPRDQAGPARGRRKRKR